MARQKKGISMYRYLLIQYTLGKLTADELRFCAPKWLSERQAEEIVGRYQLLVESSGKASP